MSLTEVLAEANRLNADDRAELVRHLRARELAEDPRRTAEVSARLDRALRGEGIVAEEDLRRRIAGQKRATG